MYLVRNCLMGVRPGLIACAFFCLVACSQSSEQAPASAMNVMPVNVITPVVDKVTAFQEYLGRFDVLDKVALYARVDGYIDAIEFVDGQEVEKGDILFVIDQRPFALALKRVQAELEAAKAAAVLAKSEYNRGQSLHKLAALSQEELDQRSQNLQSADARLAQAQVALESAQLDLEYTRIRSPIAGRIGRREVSVGNFVRSGERVLARIVATTPLYFNFSLNEADAVRYQTLLELDPSAAEIEVSLSERSEPNTYRARLDFVDIEVDQNTGTVAMRAILDNRSAQLKPGTFARARLPMSVPKEALLVPDVLIGSNQHLKTLMVVDQDNRIAVKPVQTGMLIGENRVLLSGITADEKVVSAGVQKLQPGMPVEPQFVAEPSSGVVTQ